MSPMAAQIYNLQRRSLCKLYIWAAISYVEGLKTRAHLTDASVVTIGYNKDYET